MDSPWLTQSTRQGGGHINSDQRWLLLSGIWLCLCWVPDFGDWRSLCLGGGLPAL